MILELENVWMKCGSIATCCDDEVGKGGHFFGRFTPTAENSASRRNCIHDAKQLEKEGQPVIGVTESGTGMRFTNRLVRIWVRKMRSINLSEFRVPSCALSRPRGL